MATTPPVSAESVRVSAFRRWLQNPFVSGAGWLVSVVSLPLAIYMYVVPHRHRELSYLVHPARAVIVKTGQLSRLTVSLDGTTVTTDVTAAQLAFWNEGNESIRSEHVLQSLTIKVDVPIVDAIIRKPSRDVVRLALDKSRMAQGELGVNWNILEEGDGAIVQIIFAGGPDVHMTASAVLEGQPIIRKLEVSEPSSIPAYEGKRWKPLKLSPWALLMCLGYASFGFLGEMIDQVRLGKKITVSVRMVVRAILQFIAIVLLLNLVTWFFSSVAPPFGF